MASANITLQSGYLPECSGLTPVDFSVSSAATFDPRSYSIYYIDLWSSIVPALVFGSLAAVGFLFFLAWLFVQHRRQKRRERLAKTSVDAVAAQELARARQPKRTITWGRALKLGMVVLALGLMGVCGWGIYTSIKATDEPVTSFWQIVDNTEVLLVEIVDTLTLLDEQLGNVSYALGVTSNVVQNVPGFVLLIPGVKDVVKILQTAPAEAKQTLDGLQQELVGAINGIQDTGLGFAVTVGIRVCWVQTINNIRNNFFWWTNELQDTWRFVAIAVVFGLTIILAAAAGLLVVIMRWPKWASLSTALLWLIVMVLMFLGTGLMKGAYMVSNDTCLYVESFALRVANESITSESGRETAIKAMNYYFGFTDIEDSMVVYELFGAPTHTIREVMESSLVNSVLDLLRSGSGVIGTIFSVLGVSKQDQATMLGLADLATETVQTVAEIDRLANRANIEPLYHEAKEWICCDVKDAIHKLWVAWTVAGAIGWALGALCSTRVVLHTLWVGRGASAGMGPAGPKAAQDSNTGVEAGPAGPEAAGPSNGQHKGGLMVEVPAAGPLPPLPPGDVELAKV